MANMCSAAVKLPFPLTIRFKSMLQSGVATRDLDVRWVSSLSWYFLNLFGLQPVFIFILGNDNGNSPSFPSFLPSPSLPLSFPPPFLFLLSQSLLPPRIFPPQIPMKTLTNSPPFSPPHSSITNGATNGANEPRRSWRRRDVPTRPRPG